MANHDRYEMDILKQLTRIANSLDAINKKLQHSNKTDINSEIIDAMMTVKKDD